MPGVRSTGSGRWALEVRGRTNHTKAACALANKLARIALAVWVKHEAKAVRCI